MGFRSFLVRPFARNIARSIDRWSADAVNCQEKIFRQLVASARDTVFGRDHHFSEIRSYEDFKQAVPVRDYEDLKGYIERLKQGERDILWPGQPAYFAKTSGTTSGVKYIPMSRESTPLHFEFRWSQLPEGAEPGTPEEDVRVVKADPSFATDFDGDGNPVNFYTGAETGCANVGTLP